jgi:hypothetical protein
MIAVSADPIRLPEPGLVTVSKMHFSAGRAYSAAILARHAERRGSALRDHDGLIQYP